MSFSPEGECFGDRRHRDDRSPGTHQDPPGTTRARRRSHDYSYWTPRNSSRSSRRPASSSSTNSSIGLASGRRSRSRSRGPCARAASRASRTSGSRASRRPPRLQREVPLDRRLDAGSEARRAPRADLVWLILGLSWHALLARPSRRRDVDSLVFLVFLRAEHADPAR